ncbi:hypothetical protein DFH06DRAFT_1132057 [Mycena polygramma]|nr:hypothetical protein DFH06DRAFT_1132057 [Mycena polygramma]
MTVLFKCYSQSVKDPSVLEQNEGTAVVNGGAQSSVLLAELAQMRQFPESTEVFMALFFQQDCSIGWRGLLEFNQQAQIDNDLVLRRPQSLTDASILRLTPKLWRKSNPRLLDTLRINIYLNEATSVVDRDVQCSFQGWELGRRERTLPGSALFIFTQTCVHPRGIQLNLQESRIKTAPQVKKKRYKVSPSHLRRESNPLTSSIYSVDPVKRGDFRGQQRRSLWSFSGVDTSST